MPHSIDRAVTPRLKLGREAVVNHDDAEPVTGLRAYAAPIIAKLILPPLCDIRRLYCVFLPQNRSGRGCPPADLATGRLGLSRQGIMT